MFRMKVWVAGLLWICFPLAVTLCLVTPAAGDKEPGKGAEKGVSYPLKKLAVLRAGHFNADKKIRPRLIALQVLSGALKPTANFTVDYHDFPDDAKTAFQAAVNVWGALLTTNVKVRVDAYWRPLGANVLGSAGPSSVRRDFTNAPKAATWYPVAVANKLANSDLSPGEPHIVANFSSNFTNWYYGTDSNTPANKYDLMSVVLHELGHGLGFLGSMQVGSDGQGSWGLDTPYPMIYDRFTENEMSKSLIDTGLFPNPSAALAGRLTSNHVYFNGPKAVAANGGSRVRLYAPLTWEEGSSYSHLDETTFPAGNVNSLMTPQLGMGEAIHDPGSVGLAILADFGW